MKILRKYKPFFLAAAAVFAACLFLLASGGGNQPPEQGNLLTNGDFSETENGMPSGWHTGMWVTSAGVSYLEAETMEDGTTAASVENAAANDARFEQTVSVRENTVYRLSGKIMAQGCDPAMLGANLSVLDYYGSSNDFHDTDGAWEDAVLYLHTGKGIHEITVLARLGGYGNETTGKAWFTALSLEQTDSSSVPTGVSVLEIAKADNSSGSSGSSSGFTGIGKEQSVPVLCFCALAYILLSLWVIRELITSFSPFRGKELLTRGGILLAAAGILRIFLAVTVNGYGVDIGCFSAWAGRMAQVGPTGFYTEGYFCDYPPAYMLVLGLLGKIAELTGISFSSGVGELLLKSVPIACDLILAVLLFRLSRPVLGNAAALGVLAVAAFNPSLIVSGSCWGQIDSVLTLLLVLTLIQAKAERWHLAVPLFALAVLAKPQAGLLAPLGIAAMGKVLLSKNRKDILSLAAGILSAAAVTLLIVIPFSIRQSSPFWIVNKYVETLSSYDYATLSTGNLLFLLGGNWVKNTETAFLGISYGTIGAAGMVLAFLSGIAVFLKGKGQSRLYLSSALTLQLLFVLGSKMHERYIIPALILLILAWLETGDALLLGSAVLASACTAVNVGVVLAFEYLIAPNLWLGYILSVLQILAAVMTVSAAVRLCMGKEPVSFPRFLHCPEKSETHEEEDSSKVSGAALRMHRELSQAQDWHLHLKARDYLILFVITACYAAVAFWHLGAFTAPQTGYASSAEGETVTIDLGSPQKDFRIYYYGGISDTAFSFSVSDDGIHFYDQTDAFFDRGECFKWEALRDPIYGDDGEVTGASGSMLLYTGRYIRVTFDAAGSDLREVGAVDADGKAIPAVSAVSEGSFEGRSSDPSALIDEQDTVPDKPGYYNSMYFDEIYHARTGYEHAHGLYTYETTHPPLGKVFISLFIRLWGMTPFAWRFAGTLAGVLMLPAIYLLAMQLFKKTKWAVLCTLLLALDCMHYTQTRLATIDSYPVLFMTLMFFFMARWMQMSFYHEKLSRTFVPLFFSGLFMGMAIASKWIGFYGAAGLAVLFFSRFFTLYRQSLYAAKHREDGPAFGCAADTFWEKGLSTDAACVVFFILIPLAIYIASYIPYMEAYGGFRLSAATLERIWNAQISMYDYHKNLVAEHYFASPWYEWPLIIKPMWYYNADFKAAGTASSILSFGNPAVWWTGLAGILYVLVSSLRRNLLPMLRVTRGRDESYDRAMPVIAVGFLSAYLPWMLVSRLTFIYHYFASVPFILLATAHGLRCIELKHPRLSRVLYVLLCAAALVLFIGFFPLASGLEVPRSWCDAMSWFKNWMWY